MRNIGQYKTIPNIVGDQEEVEQPHEVPDLMGDLVEKFNQKSEIDLADVLDFHYAFESIPSSVSRWEWSCREAIESQPNQR